MLLLHCGSPKVMPAWGAAVGTLPSAGLKEWGLADGNRCSHNLGGSSSSRKVPQPCVYSQLWAGPVEAENISTWWDMHHSITLPPQTVRMSDSF